MPEHRSPAASDSDEELFTGSSRLLAHAIPRRRAPLLVGVVLLAAATVLVVVLGHDDPRAPRRSSHPTGRPAASSTPIGSGVSLATRCPAGARCSTVRDLPLTTTSAVREVLPDAVITESVSLLANRPGHFEPDLVARYVSALVGGGTLTLRVGPAPPDTLPSGPRVVLVVRTPSGARAEGGVDGFVVIGTLGGRSPVSDVVRAADERALRRLVTAGALTDAQ